MPRTKTYDYFIVGAGSAGCTLAYRLTEDPDVEVLLLEAGGWDRDPWIHIPLGWGRILQRRLHDWMYFAEPSPTMDNRRIECARGKVVGGCSSINAMAYYHGHPADYDRWASTGLPEWSFRHVLPYFKRAENWEGGETAYRGVGGPLQTQYSSFQDPIIDSFLAAARAKGYGWTDDYNGPDTDGFARIQTTMVDGRRGSTARTYLKAARRRPNLTVETQAYATSIALGGNRAQGISYTQGGESHEAHAEREVILAGGAINSPHLLMLSGIGDPEAIAKHEITTRVALKGVGKNLYDHTSAAIFFKRKGPSSPFRDMMRLDRAGLAVTRAYLTGKGFATDLPFGITGFVKSRPEEPIPDLQMLFWMGATQEAKPYLPFTKPFEDRFNVRIMPMRPLSSGRLELASADPAKPILIHQGFFETDEEWRQMLTGLRMARDLVAQTEMADFAGAEVMPGASKVSDEDLKAHVRQTMITVHHPVGTAKMGPASDPLAVVDGQLRVHGIEGLRVVDASVMPDLIGGATNAPVIMIAEKAADMILGRKALPAATL